MHHKMPTLTRRLRHSTALRIGLAAVALVLATAANAQLPKVTDSPPLTDEYRLTPRSSDPDQTAYVVRFPSAVGTAIEENNTVYLEVREPRDTPRPMPVVLILHYWGATDLDVELRLAKALTTRGIAAAILTLPYHLQRTPKGMVSGEYALRPDTRFLVETMTQSVFDVKRAVDWLRSRNEFDEAKIALAGTSLGAVIGSLAFAAEPRIAAAAFMLGGVDLAHLIWSSSVTISTRNGLRAQGYTEERLREEVAQVEPMNYATPDRKADVLIVGARFDEVVPREATEKMIRAFGEPKTIWLDTGHYGGALVERRLFGTVASFFEAKFSGNGFELPSAIRAPTLRVGVHYNGEDELTVALGIDLFRAKNGSFFVSAMATPEGPSLYGGMTVSKGLTVGLVLLPRKVTWGALWSIVL
jgi:dienelactone hydrolase